MSRPENRTLKSGLSAGYIVVLLLYGIATGIYFVTRYNTQWAETDTSLLTQAVESVSNQGTIHPTTGRIYSHGFAYQALSSALTAVLGLSPQFLQSSLYPLLAGALLALVAFAFYTLVVRDSQTATLAVLFLFLQPDVLFVVLRGSHEKLDWILIMTALLLLCKSVGTSVRVMAVYVALFYLVVSALIATNVFFGSVFIVAIVIGLVVGWAFFGLLRHRTSAANLRRLVYVVLCCVLLVFVFIVYIYPPALVNVRMLGSIVDQVSVFLFSFEAEETQSGQPYHYISIGWVSRQVYFSLTAFTWLLIAFSFVEWLLQGWRILRGSEGLGLSESLDWLLYAGFAIQIAASIVVDYAGVLAQNMQLRVFPGFTVMAVALLARAMQRSLRSLQSSPRFRQAILGLVALAVSWFAVAAVLKATNEPFLSNKWTFYTWSEEMAIAWIDDHLSYAHIWTAIDERLREVYVFKYASQSNSRNMYDVYRVRPEDHHVMISERERMRALRMGIAMPSVLGWNRVYDNGDVFLYHRRPRTPYQR